MEHASDEVGIFKGFRVHKDSHGGLFLLKNHIRHYLNETDRHQIHFLDLEHMNQLPEGENILKVKPKLNEPRQVHKHDEEHRMIGIYTREGQFHGKEVFTGVYGGLYLLNNGKKIRLGNSDWNYVEDIDKEKDEKKKVGIYIGKGKKHGHLVFQGKLGALYCLINENKTLVRESEKKFVNNFQYLKTKKKQNQVNKNNGQDDEDNDSDDDSENESDDDSDENERNETEQDDDSESDNENTEESSSCDSSINGKKNRIRH